MKIGVYVSDVYLNSVIAKWLMLKGKNCEILDRNLVEFKYSVFDFEKIKYIKTYLENFYVILLDLNSQNFRFVYTLYKCNLYGGKTLFFVNDYYFSDLVNEYSFFVYIDDKNKLLEKIEQIDITPKMYLERLENILKKYPFLGYISHTNIGINQE